MAKKQATEQVEDSNLTPADMAAAVKDEIKIPRKRAAKPAAELEDEPPADPPSLEPEDDETEQPADSEVGDETEATEFTDRLQQLAQEAGVHPALLAECKDEREVDIAINAIYRAMENARYYESEQNGHTPHSNGKPQSETTADEEPPLDLSELEDLDEDSPTRKVLEKIAKRNQSLEQRIKQRENQDKEREKQAALRAQREAELAFQHTLQKQQPEIYGEPGKEGWRERQRIARAIQAGGAHYQGVRQSGGDMSMDQLAEFVSNGLFAKEIAKTKSLATANGSASKRDQRRLGNPTRGSNATAATSTKSFDGPVQNDPNIRSAVKKALAAVRR